MLYKYIFHEHAQKDYENSLQWYAQRSIKAAENFVIPVEDQGKRIKTFELSPLVD